MRWPVTWLMPSTMTVRTLCERLLRSFILVSATARFRAPISITRITSSRLLTSTCTVQARLRIVLACFSLSSFRDAETCCYQTAEVNQSLEKPCPVRCSG